MGISFFVFVVKEGGLRDTLSFCSVRGKGNVFGFGARGNGFGLRFGTPPPNWRRGCNRVAQQSTTVLLRRFGARGCSRVAQPSISTPPPVWRKGKGGVAVEFSNFTPPLFSPWRAEASRVRVISANGPRGRRIYAVGGGLPSTHTRAAT